MTCKFILPTVFFIISCSSLFIIVSAATDKIICNYNSEASSRPSRGQYLPENINASLCTHVKYLYLTVDSDGTIGYLNRDFDVLEGGILRVAGLKNDYPNLKCILALGGPLSTYYRNLVVNPAARELFVKNAVALVKKHEFDGVSIDWEYPSEETQEQYLALLVDLKANLPKGYELLATVAPNPETLKYNVKKISQIVDLLTINSYEFSSVWKVDGTIASAPLYPSSDDHDDTKNVDASITKWIEAGADPKKTILSIAFFGLTFTLIDPQVHGIGAPVSGPLSPRRYTETWGMMGYNEFCEFIMGEKTAFDDVRKVPYSYSNRFWIGYENPQSIELKVKYAIGKNLAGVLVQSVDLDDIYGYCYETIPLLEAVNKALFKH